MEQIRLAELVAGLSVVSDLGKGLTDGQGMRACRTAVELADRLQLPHADREAVFWVGLLRFVGCTATASEMAAALGDELAVSAAFATADTRDLREVLRTTVSLVGLRPSRILSFLARAPGVVREHEIASCEVAQVVAARLALPPGVGTALGEVFERWDGRGHPGLRGGEDLQPAARVWQVAHVADLLAERAEPGRVAAGLRRRAGKSLDPEIVAAAADDVSGLLARAGGDTAAVLAAEPAPCRTVGPDDADAVLGVFGLVADLKSPVFRDHSRQVAQVAAEAARLAGRPADEVAAVRGRGWWPISDGSRCRRGSGTNRARCRRWSRSRCDCTRTSPPGCWPGCRPWPWSRSSPARTTSDRTARVTTAGSAVRRSRRPSRCWPRPTPGSPPASRARIVPARTATERTALLREQSAAGRLPDAAVEAGWRPPVQRSRAAARVGALTPREQRLLELVAEGLTNVAAGRRLGISAKTVNAHLEHAYAKLGVSTRASAVVAAIAHGELSP